MTALLALVTETPLSPEQLLVVAAVILVVLIVVSFFDEKAEIGQLRDEVDALRRSGRRRDVLRVLDGRRWR